MSTRRIFTIPAGRPFADTLASGIREHWAQEDDPLALAAVRVFVPTRRSVRALQDAFRRLNGLGAPMVMPEIQPLGDVDEDDLTLEQASVETGHGPDLPPAVPDLKRRFLLAQLIGDWEKRRYGGPRARGPAVPQALKLADDLARFLDLVETEEGDLSRLEDLAPDRFSEHWQQTITFLKIVTEFWPDVLSENGVMEASARHRTLTDLRAETWRADPPQGAVIAAGVTGSTPAAARLLKVIAGLPNGEVVLPGLDTGLDEESWQHLEPSHPQFALKLLLDELECPREAVALYPGMELDEATQKRFRLIQEALRPAGTTDGWTSVSRGVATAEAAKGLTRIDTDDPAEEARVIALILREALEDDAARAALITPDRGLARRVRLELQRWGLDIDDSAGEPLAHTAPAVFLSLLADLAAENLAPVPLLSVLKHPLARFGLSEERHHAEVCRLERLVLRGPRPAPGLEGLEAAVAHLQRDDPGTSQRYTDDLSALAAYLGMVKDGLGPLLACFKDKSVILKDCVMAHVAAAEYIAYVSDEPGCSGCDRMWGGDAGESLVEFIADLLKEGEVLPSFEPSAYPAVFQTLLAGQVVRIARGRHPRLFIWGPLEARLQHADCLVLGGLNEGVWPADPALDPWLNRAMRHDLGLSSPERRIGLAAHDFAQLAAGPRVVLTRANKVDGTPQVPSRWLLRLENLLKGAGTDDLLAPEYDYRALARQLDAPDTALPRAGEPRPTPPVETRPGRLAATRVELLIRDPYAVYCRYVLRLRPLDPIDADPGAADRGTIIHDALDEFIRAYPGPAALPADAFDRLCAIGQKKFEATLDRPGVRAFWWPRFLHIARWFIDREQGWRPQVAHTVTEAFGELALPTVRPFTVEARADRIDELVAGGYVITDYKTGIPPSKPQVESGLAPQMPVEGLILQEGGFKAAGLPGGPVSQFLYIRLKGGSVPGEELIVGGPQDAPQFIAMTRDRLTDLIDMYAKPETPYLSRLRPKMESYAGDYDHLARVKEWSAFGEES